MTEVVVHLFREALLLAAILSLPPLAAAWLTQVIVATLQQSAKLPDARGLAHAPQLLAVGVALAIAGPWTTGQLVNFARVVFEAIATAGAS